MSEISAPSPRRVYCAGPLFNQSERAEMTEIADLLTTSGFEVYLPHRDGMEFRHVLDELTARGWTAAMAGRFLHSAIFALDVYQLVAECGSMVWNLNGRVPDEGAVSEAAMVWMLGKPLVAYKDDFRAMIAGRDNPLLAGLVEFEFIADKSHIAMTLERAIEACHTSPLGLSILPPAVQRAVGQGSLLWTAMQSQEAQGNNLILADIVAELFAPSTTN